MVRNVAKIGYISVTNEIYQSEVKRDVRKEAI